jgi:hypothetical protein
MLHVIAYSKSAEQGLIGIYALFCLSISMAKFPEPINF